MDIINDVEWIESILNEIYLIILFILLIFSLKYTETGFKLKVDLHDYCKCICCCDKSYYRYRYLI